MQYITVQKPNKRVKYACKKRRPDSQNAARRLRERYKALAVFRFYKQA